MRRRQLLGAAAAAAGLAGCSAGTGIDDALGLRDPIHEGSTRFEIPAGSFEAVDFAVDGRANLEYSVTVIEGPDVDAILMNEGNYGRFEDGGEWQYYPGGTALGIAETTERTRLAPGPYYLVVDNSDRGAAAPRPPGGATPTGSATPTPFETTATVDLSYEVF